MVFNYGNEEQGLSSFPENSYGKVVGDFSLNDPMHQIDNSGSHCVKLMLSKPSGKLQCDYFVPHYTLWLVENSYSLHIFSIIWRNQTLIFWENICYIDW